MAGTTNGVFLSSNNGTNWTSVNSGLPPYKIVSSLCFDGNNLFAGFLGSIYFSTDNGINWSEGNINIKQYSYVISLAVHGTTLFAGTQDEGVFRSTDGGINWEKVFTKDNVCDFIIIGENIFASTSGGVFLSTDNGASWIAKNNGLPKNEDGNYNVGYFAVNRENLFIGSKKGVFRSTDNGGNWLGVNSGLPENTFVFAFAVIGENIFIGTGTYTDTNVIAGVFLSTNNGTSWNNVSLGLPQIGDIYISALVIAGNNIFAGTDGAGGFSVWRRPLSEITDVKSTPELPKEFALYQNYPNPFNPTTTINYHVSKKCFVTIKVFNVLGKGIATLVNEEKPAGNYEIEFNGSNLSSGVYFYRMQTGNFIDTKKFILIK